MTRRELNFLLAGIVIGFGTGVFAAASAPLLLPAAYAQELDERSWHLLQSLADDGDPGRSNPEPDCVGVVAEHPMPHAYCYTINGESAGCVPRLAKLWVEQ